MADGGASGHRRAATFSSCLSPAHIWSVFATRTTNQASVPGFVDFRQRYATRRFGFPNYLLNRRLGLSSNHKFVHASDSPLWLLLRPAISNPRTGSGASSPTVDGFAIRGESFSTDGCIAVVRLVRIR